MRIAGTAFFVGPTAWPGGAQNPAAMLDGSLTSGVCLSSGANGGSFFPSALFGIRFDAPSLVKWLRLGFYSQSQSFWHASKLKVSGYHGENPTSTVGLADLDLLGEWSFLSGAVDSAGTPIVSLPANTTARYDFSLLDNIVEYDGIVFWTDSTATGVMYTSNPGRLGFSEIEALDGPELFVTQVPQSVLTKDSYITPVQTTQTPQAILTKDATTPIQITQVPHALLTTDSNAPNIFVGASYVTIAYAYDKVDVNVTQNPQLIFAKDGVSPIQITQLPVMLLTNQGETERRFTQVAQALLVKEDASRFFLNYRALVLPEMKTLYNSGQARAFMVGETDYIQLEGNLPDGSYLLRNGVNVGLTTPIANGDVIEIRSGVVNYYTLAINIYRYEWDGNQIIRELVGLWPVTQPELSPVWRASQERGAVHGQWIADYLNHAENEFEPAAITQPKVFEIQITPDVHQFKFATGSLAADIHQYKFAAHELSVGVTKPKTLTHSIAAISRKYNFAEGITSYVASFDQIDKANVYAYMGSGKIHNVGEKTYVSNTSRNVFVDQEFEASFGNMHSILNMGYIYAGATYTVASGEYENSYANVTTSGVEYEGRTDEILLADMNFVDNAAVVHKIIAMNFASYGDSVYAIDNKTYVASNDSVMYVEINFVPHIQAISKVLQEYDVVTERARLVDQYFIRYQYFPKDAEQSVIPVSYKIEVGSVVYVDQKYYIRDSQNTKIVDLVPVANSQNSQAIAFNYEKFGTDSAFVKSWYSKSEYRQTLVKQLYAFYKPTMLIVESPKAMVYTYPETFYYSAGRYAGFDTIQEFQEFTEYFEGTKAIPAYDGYRYTTEVDETFVCELVSNGPVKWLLQGG